MRKYNFTIVNWNKNKVFVSHETKTNASVRQIVRTTEHYKLLVVRDGRDYYISNNPRVLKVIKTENIELIKKALDVLCAPLANYFYAEDREKYHMSNKITSAILDIFVVVWGREIESRGGQSVETGEQNDET